MKGNLVIAVYLDEGGQLIAKIGFGKTPEAFITEIQTGYGCSPWKPVQIETFQALGPMDETPNTAQCAGILEHLDDVNGEMVSPWHEFMERLIAIGAELGRKLG